MNLETYENEILGLLRSLNEHIEKYKNLDIENNTKEQLSSDIDALFVHINESIRELDVESRNRDIETKRLYQDKIVGYKKQISNFQNDYQRRKLNMQRSDLLDGRSKADQDRYLTVNDKLNRQQKAIENATRSANETEAVGNGIIQGLEDNRNKITEVQSKTSTLNNEVSRAGEILKSMEKRDNCTIM